MKEYVRSPKCECANYSDKDLLDFKSRMELKDYWMRGYIYRDNDAVECTCHKAYRLTGRYNRLAKAAGLPDQEELSKLKYLGESDVFEKLKKLPQTVTDHNLKDVLILVTGKDGCQKTTSLAKLTYRLTIRDQFAKYINFTDLIEGFTEKTIDYQDLMNADWLIVDNCFEGETINFKTIYNQFYNLILKRKKPTVLATSLSRDDLQNRKDLPSYSPEMLTKLFIKLDKYSGTTLEFTDNVDKVLIGDKKIDIWSL